MPGIREKGGRFNVCYISGFNPDWYTRCCPCEFDLSDLQGEKEIAATTAIVKYRIYISSYKSIYLDKTALYKAFDLAGFYISLYKFIYFHGKLV